MGWMRRVSLGRRIWLPIGVYALALVCMAFAGWRTISLVGTFNADAAALRQDAKEVAELSRLVTRLQAEALAYLNGQDTATADAVTEVEMAIRDHSLVVQPETMPDRGPIIVGLVRHVNRYLESFSDITEVDSLVNETYDAIESQSTQASGLFKILSRASSQGSLPGTLGASVLQANDLFVGAMVDINAYYFRRKPERARSAIGALDRIAASIDVMRALADSSLHANALDGIQARAGRLSKDVQHLIGLFEGRDWLVRQSLHAAQQAMEADIARLLALQASREDQLQAGLEQGTWETLRLTGAMLLALLLFGLAVNAAITASIRGPILDLNAIMQDLAHGNWERTVTGGDARDEIGAMARTLGVFKANALRMRELEVEKRDAIAREKEETERALAELDDAHREIQALNRQLSGENLRLSAEVDVSRRLQMMLLPREEELRTLDGIDVAGFMEPAEEVGGDYYDVLRKSGAVRIGIGDVTGHGLESGVVMLMTQSAVRTLNSLQDDTLTSSLAVLNRTIYENVQRMGSERNLSFLLAEYVSDKGADGRPLASGTLSLVGQHETVIVIRADGGVEEFDTLDLGMPIGLLPDIAEFTNAIRIPLHEGDCVVFYTDGITEAENPQREFYGIDRLKAVCRAQHLAPAARIVETLVADLRHFIGTQRVHDDITLVVLKQEAPALRDAADQSSSLIT